MKVNTCCGCCSLQSGTIAVGILHVALAIMSIIFQAYGLTQLTSLYAETPERMVLYYWSRAFAYAVILVLLILMALAGLMIYGTLNGIRKYLFPYVSLGFGQIIFGFGYVAGYLIFICSVPGLSAAYVTGGFIGAALGMTLQIYLWLVVYSFYKEMDKHSVEKPSHLSNRGYAVPITQNV